METHSRQLQVFNNAYRQYYQTFAWRCRRSVKNEVTASGMVHDAFLRLWLLRDQLSVDDIYSFLKRQLKKAVLDYYGSDRYRFDSRLFSLDDFDNPDLLMPSMETPEDAEVTATVGLDEKDDRWLRLQEVLASLNDGQQQMVKLCLKHNFDYGRIAFYLGGISDYAVGKKVEDLVASLKQILTDGQKLDRAVGKNKIIANGSLDELQEQVLRMRYELAYSFEEVANALGLSETQVNVAYAKACRVCK
ncbi:MAG: hypothetical protein EOP49_33585 [Sphingobacteriales bacterium]|nr:MAG: hypothetical protein EOP49_33585 [Sphingobacteriales bacterium]